MWKGKRGKLAVGILDVKHFNKDVSFCLYTLPFSFLCSPSLVFLTRATHKCTSSPRKLEFQKEKRLEFFHSLPQTSSNLSFSLQWSNGDVCSSLVQLNFKELYAHAQYHYCKHNYHKLSFAVCICSPCVWVRFFRPIHLQILIQRLRTKEEGWKGTGRFL